MVKVEVLLSNDFDRDYKEIVISKEELLQLACNKAKGMYEDGYWNYISADEVQLNMNL